MSKKGIGVWIFSTLTVIAAAHLIDAANAIIFNKPTVLLQVYPVPKEKLKEITPPIYFLIGATATFILWGITCAIAFQSPVEAFLNRVLSDAKKQRIMESQLLEQKSELLDAMNETVETNNEILSHVKDVIYNIRAEVKEIQPLKESLEKIKAELSHLKREIKSFEEKFHYPKVCFACGKPILPEFNICPYCGEALQLVQERMILLEKYR